MTCSYRTERRVGTLTTQEAFEAETAADLVQIVQAVDNMKRRREVTQKLDITFTPPGGRRSLTGWKSCS